MPAITIRPMRIEELDRVNEIDISESGTIVFKQAGRHVESTQEEWHRPRRDEASWNRHIEAWKPVLERGGSAIGAFDGRTLVGIAVLRPHLTEHMAQLAALFVDKSHWRLGVATRLTEETARLARESGASALYVSAIPSESAVGFYISQGFQPIEHPDKELYELEPDDVHMIKPL